MALAWFALALASFSGAAHGQTARPLITKPVDPARLQVLADHHPLWANAANDAGPVVLKQAMEALAVVVARPAEQENVFEKFLADQQDPASPEYHHWLTPAQVGERFGPSDADIDAIAGWLQSQGLHVNWVAPSKLFIGFGGTAGDVSRAFGAELRHYRVNGVDRISVASDPMVPEAVAPAIKAVHGLYTIDEAPQHDAATMDWDSPEITASNGTHYIGPGDFYNIYSLPNGITGAGITIGIAGRSRTNAADFSNFKTLFGSSFSNPTEIVPTAFGGVDPGPAYTAPPGTGVSIGDQSEATLDVLRTGSVAPGAQLLLVVATQASGGIETDAQYLVNTTPAPVQVMTISFGACELAAGAGGVNYWDAVFKQAAAEGISSFVSSGDSGASGCDAAFTTPPASPVANSPNYICSSSYATCVGGTEFNDTANPTAYWNSYSGSIGTTAYSYIPEGGWNESWNGTASTVAASGGGVSLVIATPSWQIGVPGVPTATTGRYTPDVSFSASAHDGYFGCFAAGGASCVVSNGSFYFTAFSGTSAAAPSMAGIAALLDQNLAGAQGNLNPGIYQMWYGALNTFHDVTINTSGLTTCDINTPSMCNNSIPGPSGLSGGQAGYAIGTGYDQVTGLGSLNVTSFVSAYATTSKITTPTVRLVGTQTANTYEPIMIEPSVVGNGDGPVPTGSVVVTIGSYTSAPVTLTTGYAIVNIPAGTFPVGNYTVIAKYTPDANSAPVYTTASATELLSITAPPKVSPTLTLTPSQLVISNSQTLNVTVVASGPQYYPTPTGSVVLTSGGYSPASVALVGGKTIITIPPGSLAVGNDLLTVSYTPDVAGSSNYFAGSNIVYVQNEGDRITPTIQLMSSSQNITTGQALTVAVIVNGFTGNPVPTGTVVLTGGGYTSAAISLSNGDANITVPAGALQIGADTLIVSFTPDAQSAGLYSSASGSNSVGVSLAQKITPTVTSTPTTSNPITTQPLSLTATVSSGSGYPAPTGSVTFWDNNYFSLNASLSGGSATVTAAPGSFGGGANSIEVTYQPDTPSSYYYVSASITNTVTVAKGTPAVSVTPSSPSALTTDTVNVTVAVSGGSGAPNASGTVTLTSGSYSAQGNLNGGTASITVAPGSLGVGTDTLTAAYTGDTNYNSANGTASVVVSLPAGAGFGIAATNLSLTKGTASGNTSTVTVTPTNGFVGTVTLSAAITSGPAGAQNPPSLSFGSTSPASLINLKPATATLTITTTAATSGAVSYPARPGARWYTAGGAALACLVFFLVPIRRRQWMNWIGLAGLFVLCCGGAASCGGGSANTGGGGGGGNPGTTSGQYTVTVTGISGSMSVSNTLTLTVQ